MTLTVRTHEVHLCGEVFTGQVILSEQDRHLIKLAYNLTHHTDRLTHTSASQCRVLRLYRHYIVCTQMSNIGKVPFVASFCHSYFIQQEFKVKTTNEHLTIQETIIPPKCVLCTFSQLFIVLLYCVNAVCSYCLVNKHVRCLQIFISVSPFCCSKSCLIVHVLTLIIIKHFISLMILTSEKG